MTALVAVETLLLVLLAILVAALLRSHAEILRRLGPEREAGNGDVGGEFDPALPRPPERTGTRPASDIAGATLEGRVVQIGIAPGGPATLLAFLTSGCLVCENFWSAFREGAPALPGGGRLVIVTKDSSHESPSRLRELAPAEVPVVMSSSAWRDYDVPTAPYFVYVDGASGEVYGEGAATGWRQVASLLRDALDDAVTGDPGSPSNGDAEVRFGRGGRSRARRVDEELEAAGIGTGHFSLYPGKEPSPE